jgi:uncharacterized protein YdaL
MNRTHLAVQTVSVLSGLVMLVSLSGCNAYDIPNVDHNHKMPESASAAPAAAATDPAAAPAADPVPVTIVGNSDSGHNHQTTMNPFPADFGTAQRINNGRHLLVPQNRGMDTRPSAPAVTVNEFATAPSGTLILYDSTGAYGWLGELYGIAAITLAGHFGTTASKPVVNYVAGDIAKYKAVIYVGSTYDEPLPVAFLDDVLATTVPVMWIYDNIWQLANRSTTFATTYGFNPWVFDFATVGSVTYRGTALTRDATNACGLMTFSTLDTTKVATLATATRADGTTLPWAIRSTAKNFTYVTENPFAYIDFNDRYLAFCDMLFDLIAPTTATQHRALARLEDVSPVEDASAIKTITDYLYAQSVPFSIALIPLYKDPLGIDNGGVNTTIKWTDSATKQLLTNIKYATTHGGTVIMHGYTHQYGSQKNPYSGISADDFEFFMAHVDAATNNVIYDGAVPGDSASWATGRVNSGLSAIKAAGLTAPTIFEYPHYAGSAVDSKAIKGVIGTAYHRGLFFTGDLGINTPTTAHSIGLFYPYAVTDVYGWKVKPENLGNYEPLAYNNHPPRLPADLAYTATKNLIVRDGVASFFFHPYYPIQNIKDIVTGIKAAGYKFVAASAVL